MLAQSKNLFRDIKLTVIIVLCGALNGVNIAKLAPSIHSLSTDFGLSLSQIGLLASMFTSIMVLTGVLMGGIVRAVGARRVLIGALAVACAGNGIAVVYDSVAALFAGRAAEGITLIAVTLTGPAILAQYTDPTHRGWVMGAWGGFMPLGNGLAILTAASLIKIGGWQLVWEIALGFSVLITGIAAFLIPKDPNPIAIKFDRYALIAAVKLPLLAFIGISFACHSLVYQTLLQFIPLISGSLGGFSAGQGAIIAGLFCAVNFIGNLTAGQLLQKRWHPTSIIRIAFAGILILLVILAQAELSSFVIAILLICIGFLSGSSAPIFFYLVSKSTTEAQDLPVFVAWVFQIQGLGMLIGPALVSRVVETSESWASGFWCLLPACLVISILSGKLKLPDRTLSGCKPI
jgi:MFS family permease